MTIKKYEIATKKLGGFQVFSLFSFLSFFFFFKDKPREEINEDAARKRQRAKNIAPCWNLWAPASACVCFMLFDGSRGERLTVCQCHSLSADASAPGTRFGKINNKKHKNENARSALQRRGLPPWHSRQNPGKKNVKSSHLRCWLEWWRHGSVRLRSPRVSSCPCACACSYVHIF